MSLLLRITLAVLTFSHAAAAFDGPLHVVVTTHGHDDAFAQRLRGQTSDLDVLLDTAQSEASSSDLGGALADAVRAAQAMGADVVVGLSPEGGHRGWILWVSQVHEGRTLLRRIDDETSSPEPRSATIEAAALIVRDALEALAIGGQVGVASSQLRVPVPTSAGPASSAPVSPAPASSVRPSAFIGWQVTSDGQSPAGQHALAAGVNLGTEAWQLGALATMGVGATLVDPEAEIHVARHSIALAPAAVLVRWPRVALSMAVPVGVVAFVRSAAPREPSLVALAPATRWRAFAGPELRARFALGAASGWGFALAAGFDAVPKAPAFGYDTASGFQSTRVLWWVEPKMSLGLDFGRF